MAYVPFPQGLQQFYRRTYPSLLRHLIRSYLLVHFETPSCGNRRLPFLPGLCPPIHTLLR